MHTEKRSAFGGKGERDEGTEGKLEDDQGLGYGRYGERRGILRVDAVRYDVAGTARNDRHTRQFLLCQCQGDGS